MTKEDWRSQAEHREEVRRALPVWYVERDGFVVAQGLPHDEARELCMQLIPFSREIAYGRPRSTDNPWRGMFRLALVP